MVKLGIFSGFIEYFSYAGQNLVVLSLSAYFRGRDICFVFFLIFSNKPLTIAFFLKLPQT